MTSVIKTYDRNTINTDYKGMLSLSTPSQRKLAFDELFCLVA